MPLGVKEAFFFIKRNTPADALFMYPEYIFIEATGRRFIWSSFFQLEFMVARKKYPGIDIHDKSLFLFWRKDPRDILGRLQLNKVDYIVVKKSRIYDDSKEKHFGGYPKSFVERLPQFPFLKLIFENKEIVIWKIT